ncbi:MAG: HRDC domain-containing protein [Planctomycetes bacterium]|nr:HRDC domain-containing protein [Planctomycetota bacterium]
MPYRLFLLPVTHSEIATEELNAFVACHRVVRIEQRWIEQGNQSAWAFCVEYVLTSPSTQSNPRANLSRNRIDYKTILSPDEFTIFSMLRELRKEVSQQEGVPVFALFSNEQLAQMVQRRCTSKADLLSIEGIGEAKVEKYSETLLATLSKFPSSLSSSESP